MIKGESAGELGVTLFDELSFFQNITAVAPADSSFITSGLSVHSSPGRWARCSSRHLLPKLLQLPPCWTYHVCQQTSAVDPDCCCLSGIQPCQVFPHHSSQLTTLPNSGTGLQGSEGSCSFLHPSRGQTLILLPQPNHYTPLPLDV